MMIGLSLWFYFYWNDKEIEVNPVKENGEIDRNTKVYLTLKSSLDFVKFFSRSSG